MTLRPFFSTPKQLSMMSDEPNDTAVATSPDPTEEVDAADAECAAPVEAVPVEAALNPADEVDQLKVPRISSFDCVSTWRGKCDGTSAAMFVKFSW